MCILAVFCFSVSLTQYIYRLIEYTVKAKDAAKNGRMVALHLGVQAQFTIDGKLCRSYTDKEKAYDNFKL